jgi:hypothetical protein
LRRGVAAFGITGDEPPDLLLQLGWFIGIPGQCRSLQQQLLEVFGKVRPMEGDSHSYSPKDMGFIVVVHLAVEHWVTHRFLLHRKFLLEGNDVARLNVPRH